MRPTSRSPFSATIRRQSARNSLRTWPRKSMNCRSTRSTSKNCKCTNPNFPQSATTSRETTKSLKSKEWRASPRSSPRLSKPPNQPSRSYKPSSKKNKVNHISNAEALKKRDEDKQIAKGTSKTNYNDPRISVAWCKKNEVKIEKIFPKTLLSKFLWAMYSDADFEFWLAIIN